MKTFKVRDGKVTIDGVTYSEKLTETKIVGKTGKGYIHSISIGGKQFFPLSGVFDDGSIKVTNDSTGIVEEVVKPKRTKKSK
jgi:capsule polysaccharide export protein KpsC/LpsZ